MDERDQDVQRTPLWPPDPEPDSEAPRRSTPAPTPEQAPDWAANWASDAPPDPPPPAASPYQPYQPAPEPPSAQPWPAAADPWSAASDPWEDLPPDPAQQLSEAPTQQYAASAPMFTATDAPTARVSAAPPSMPAPMRAVSDAPTAHVSAAPPSMPAPMPAASEAPTEQYTAAPPAPPVTPVAPRSASTPPAADAPLSPPASATPAAPALPTSARPPAPPAAPATPRKRSGVPWRLGLTLLVSVFLLVGAVSVYSHAQALAAEPQKLMASYCAALTHDDYHAAYGLLSSSAQAQQPEAQYLADAAARDTIEGRITACSAQPTQALSALSFLRSPRSLIFNAQFTRAKVVTGQIALTRDTQGWHVAALSSPLQGIDLGPLATQQALCKAFSQRDYNQAFALLSTPYQQEQGAAATFARSFGDTLTITACAADLKTYSVNSADQQASFDVTLTLSFVGATTGSPPSTFTLPTQWTFVREATGWRVDEIKPMLSQ